MFGGPFHYANIVLEMENCLEFLTVVKGGMGEDSLLIFSPYYGNQVLLC